MRSENEPGMSYIDDAFAAFNEIMLCRGGTLLEDITRANKGELFILHFLSMRNTQVFPTELSAALNATTGRISALLGNLEKKGLLERDIDKSNRRNILVTITEAGRRHIETEISKIQGGLSKVFTDMGEADAAEFLRLLRIFTELMVKHMPRREEGK